MTKSSSPKKIGIFGHVGTQNLGDEIIIAAVLQNIRSRYPDAEIRAFTFNPDDTRARHGIPAFPIRRRKPSAPATASQGLQSAGSPNPPTASSPHQPGGGLRAILKKIPFLFGALKALQNGVAAIHGFLEELAFLARSRKNLRGTDLLMIAGSGQLTDASGGAWAYPYTFFKWFLLARSVGTKIAFVSIGTGWIDSSLSKFFLRAALRGADYRSFREESAVQRVEALGVTGENPIVPDLAYSLQMPATAAVPSGSRKIAGINPIPFFHPVLWHEADSARYTAYVDAHADFALWLFDRGYSVVFFPTQLRADPPVIADVIAAMERRRAGVSAQLLPTPQLHTGEDLLAAMANMDFVVAARFHGVLVSHLLGKPVLGVSYHQKTADLMARMGQQDCTLRIEDCSPETLKQTFCFIESHQAAIRADFARRVPECRAALDSQYERVFGLLEPRTGATKTLNTSVVPAKEPSNARIHYGS